MHPPPMLMPSYGPLWFASLPLRRFVTSPTVQRASAEHEVSETRVLNEDCCAVVLTGVVLTWTVHPGLVLADVDLSCGVVEAKESARQNRYEILLVVDVHRVERGIDEVGECLVSDLSRTHMCSVHRSVRDVDIDID
jgi:hypothetical protein